jgi:purine-cytosine permease-like protein
MRPTVPSYLVFIYTFLGLYLPCALIQILGAAFAAAALSGEVPTWEAAFGDGSVGGLVGVAMEPMKGFGKFLLVIFSLGMICAYLSLSPLSSLAYACPVRAANNAPTQYAFSLSLQIVFPFLTRLPRFLLPIAGTAIYLPIAIAAAAHFAAALSNFLGLLGYCEFRVHVQWAEGGC